MENQRGHGTRRHKQEHVDLSFSPGEKAEKLRQLTSEQEGIPDPATFSRTYNETDHRDLVSAVQLLQQFRPDADQQLAELYATIREMHRREAAIREEEQALLEELRSAELQRARQDSQKLLQNAKALKTQAKQFGQLAVDYYNEIGVQRQNNQNLQYSVNEMLRINALRDKLEKERQFYSTDIADVQRQLVQTADFLQLFTNINVACGRQARQFKSQVSQDLNLSEQYLLKKTCAFDTTPSYESNVNLGAEQATIATTRLPGDVEQADEVLQEFAGTTNVNTQFVGLVFKQMCGLFGDYYATRLGWAAEDEDKK